MIEIRTKGGPVRRFPTTDAARNYLRGCCVISAKAPAQVTTGGVTSKGTVRELFDQLNEGRIRVPQTTTQGGLF